MTCHPLHPIAKNARFLTVLAFLLIAEKSFSCEAAESSGGPAKGELPRSARYTVWTTPEGVQETWYFHRSSGLVILQGPHHQDLWRRNASAQISLERVFPKEGRSVFYSPGELQARGVTMDWEALWSLWDPRQAPVAARVAETAGEWRWHGPRVDVLWSNHLALPVELIRPASDAGRSRVHWRLLAHAPHRPADWPAPAAPVPDRIDAADLGDRPVDAFVHRVEQLEIQSGWHASSHPEGPP